MSKSKLEKLEALMKEAQATNDIYLMLVLHDALNRAKRQD